MTRETAHGSRRVANRTPRGRGGHGTATTRNIEDGNRAANTFRRRYHHRAMAPSPPPRRNRLVDRMTHEDGSQVERVVETVRGNITRDYGNIRARAETRTATQGSGLFRTQDVETRPTTHVTETQPSTQGPSPSQSQAPIAGPVREPRITTRKSKASIPPVRMLNRPENVSAGRGNKYRGKDVIKRAVQNPKLRAVLAGKPLPRPQKKQLQPLLTMDRKNMGGAI